MTQENKELLLKDLCARLQYGIKVFIINEVNIEKDVVLSLSNIPYIQMINKGYIKECKPYLFPLSSMTEEMIEELNAYGFFKYRDTITNVSHLISNNGINEEIYTYIDIECVLFLIEFFNSHHIDYRGLIEKGLAIDATGLNVY